MPPSKSRKRSRAKPAETENRSNQEHSESRPPDAPAASKPQPSNVKKSKSKSNKNTSKAQAKKASKRHMAEGKKKGKTTENLDSNDGDGVHGGDRGVSAGAGAGPAHHDPPPSIEAVLRSLVQNPGSYHPHGFSFSHGSSSRQREKINALIDMIENSGNPSEQLTGLSELCEHVSIASEESIMSFPTDRVVPLLLEELQESDNPDVMLLAARVVTLLLDVYPPSARLVSQYGGVGVFCEKLLSIEYIDLAEQSIQALGKISESYPSLLLDTSHGNVLDAVLSFIDFFQVGMQRIAVATAANVCRAMTSGDGHHIPGNKDSALEALTSLFRASIPGLLQLTTSSDNKIALSAFQALTSVAKSCSLAQVPVESVIDIDCMQMVLGRLVAVGGTNVTIKPCVFYALARFVSTYTSTSVELPKRLLDQQAPCVVANILALLSTKAQAASVGGVMGSLKDLKPRNQDEMFVLLSLVDNMLPTVLASDLRVFDRSKTKREMKTLEAEGLVVRDAAGPKNLESMRSELLDQGSSGPAAEAEGEAPQVTETTESVEPVEVIEVIDVAETSKSRLDAVAPVLLDALLHLEFATLSRDSKMGVLSVVDKILFYASPACLTKLVAELPVSVFVIRLLQSSNHAWPLSSLKFVAIMLQKEPDLKKVLLREGIMHEVRKTKETFLALGQAERDLSAAYVWFADRVLSCSFGENVRKGGVSGDDETEGMLALRTLRESVAAAPDDDERVLAAMGGFVKLVLDRAVSSYEINASGILEDVHAYLTGGSNGAAGGTAGAPAGAVGATCQARKNSFLALLGSPEATERVIDTVQEILMNSEHLQVIKSMTHAMPSFQSMLLSNLGLSGRAVGLDGPEDDREGDPFVNGLKALGTPLRIKLRCMDEALRDRLSGTAILIEPLATVAQTQGYLKPKIARLLTPKLTEQLKKAAGDDHFDRNAKVANDANVAIDGSKGTNKGTNKGKEVVTRSRAKQLAPPAGMGGSKLEQKVDDEKKQALPKSSDDSYDSEEYSDDDMEVLEELLDSEGEDEDIDMVEGDAGDAAAIDAPRADAQRTDRNASARDDSNFSIKLYLDGKELDTSDTLLRVLHAKNLTGLPANSDSDLARVWQETHQIDIRVCFGTANGGDNGRGAVPMDTDASGASDASVAASLKDVLCPPTGSADRADVPVDCQVYYAVRVLQVFEETKGASSEYRPLLVNSKICSKLTKQMKDPLLVCSRTLPDWCSRLPYLAKFLFSYESRRMYFRYHAFGLGRTTLAMLEDASGATANAGQGLTGDLPFRAPRIARQKVRISRTHVLESSRKVFERYADAKSRLEVEFYNEAGSGLGPTLEFYTLLSMEFQRRDLGMWRDADATSTAATAANNKSGDSLPGPKAGELPVTKKTKELISCRFGLFPRPVPLGTASAALKNNFKLLGQAAAKAIQDGRLLDIPLSRPFYKLSLLGPGSLDREDLQDIDPDVQKTLSEIQHAVTSAAASTTGTVTLKGVPIDDLCLSFVLPGDDTYELCPGGADVTITSQNAAEYVQGVYDALLDSGVRDQMAAFREGFNGIFPLEQLRIFYEDEIEAILCGDAKETWTPESLAAAIKCDHGYMSSSPPVVALIDVLSNLDPVDKRRFLKFVTGAPRLPAGGWSALKPRFTVVRKNPDVPMPPANADAEPLSPKTRDQLVAMYADKDLPSVMTCANYLKLPPYSAKDVLRDRLLFSIREGQNSFDLS